MLNENVLCKGISYTPATSETAWPNVAIRSGIGFVVSLEELGIQDQSVPRHFVVTFSEKMTHGLSNASYVVNSKCAGKSRPLSIQ